MRATAEIEESYKAPIAASSKTDTPLRDVPQSISVVTRQSIDDWTCRTSATWLRTCPGVGMAQGEGNRETPSDTR